MDERTEEAIARFILEAWANTTRSGPTSPIVTEIRSRWPDVTADEIRRAAIIAVQLGLIVRRASRVRKVFAARLANENYHSCITLAPWRGR
jgi:hypothetical protein